MQSDLFFLRNSDVINISMDGVLARKNGKKDCYYEWTVGFCQVKVGKCSMEVKG